MKKILSLLVLILTLNSFYGQSNNLMISQMLAGGDIHVGVNISTWENEIWELSGDIVIVDEATAENPAEPVGKPASDGYILAAKEQELLEAFDNLKTPEVGLMQFSAAATDGTVAVDWISVPTKPLNYFLVQRSENKKNWSDLGMVLAPQNAGPMSSYHYEDRYPERGTNYYRLKQADTQSQIAHSEVIAVEMFDIGYHVMHIYPNAMIFGANINLHLHATAEVDIILRDSDEIEVGKIYAARTSAGVHSIDIDLSELPYGKYTCEIKVGDSIAIRELVK